MWTSTGKSQCNCDRSLVVTRPWHPIHGLHEHWSRRPHGHLEGHGVCYHLLYRPQKQQTAAAKLPLDMSIKFPFQLNPSNTVSVRSHLHAVPASCWPRRCRLSLKHDLCVKSTRKYRVHHLYGRCLHHRPFSKKFEQNTVQAVFQVHESFLRSSRRPAVLWKILLYTSNWNKLDGHEMASDSCASVLDPCAGLAFGQPERRIPQNATVSMSFPSARNRLRDRGWRLLLKTTSWSNMSGYIRKSQDGSGCVILGYSMFWILQHDLS